MEGEGRSKRSTAGQTRGGQKAKSALQELAELRKSGGKRLDRFETKEEEDVYDVVDDQEYAKLVQKRREEGGECQSAGPPPPPPHLLPAAPPGPRRRLSTAPPPRPLHAGGFVIDEDGLGYTDVGEEIDWGVAEEEPQAEGEGSGGKGKAKKGERRAAPQLLCRLMLLHTCLGFACMQTAVPLLTAGPPTRRPPNAGAAGAKRKAAAEPVPGARVRMQKMFQSAQAKAKPARAAVDDASADALLDDILGGLDGGSAAPASSARCAALGGGAWP